MVVIVYGKHDSLITYYVPYLQDGRTNAQSAEDPPEHSTMVTTYACVYE
jgi:hypothetical protein